MLEVAEVLPGSIAERRGIRKGDRLISINGRDVRDSIDLQFLSADERLSLVVGGSGGGVRTLKVRKDPDEALGIGPGPLVVRQCRNKCIFCFVDQMPPGCRRSLYVRDDDYRASFLYGNYITLTNLREEDWERIFSQRLSPLYVSVHATEPGLRGAMMRGRSAPDVLAGMRRLAAGDIRMHTQLVLCPGINDGAHLVRSLEDLARLFPAVRSVAVVPVGLTGYRTGLYRLRAFTRTEARSVVETVRMFALRFRRAFGTRLVFASDELYVQAGLDVPALREYEDLPQIENGVGMVSRFLDGAGRARLLSRVQPVRMTAVTGMSFAPLLRRALRRLDRMRGASVRILPVRNALFGPSVTVSGLLGGKDILRAAQGKRLGSMLLVPSSAVKEDEGVFLDDVRLGELEAALGVPVRPVGSFSDVVRLVRAAAKARRRRRSS